MNLLQFRPIQLVDSILNKTTLLRRKRRARRRAESLESRLLLTQFLVDNLADESDLDFSQGDFSFREAVEEANISPGSDTIQFHSSLFGQTINLQTSGLSITEDLVIVGPGADVLTIDGSNSGRIITVGSGVTASISGLRFINATDGAIGNSGTLTLQNSVLENNNHAGNGGAINSGTGTTLTVANSILRNNMATGSGGSIGAGGAINSHGQLTIQSSTIEGNSSGIGGGIRHDAIPGSTIIISSRIIGNTATAGNGGGIYSNTQGGLLVRDSTFAQNSADNGGGLWIERGTTNILNSTVSGNSAATGGGGMSVGHNVGTLLNLAIRNSTITLNNTTSGSGGGIEQTNFPITLHNTIVAGNTSGPSQSTDDDVSTQGAGIDAGSSNNLIGTNAGVSVITNGSQGNQIGTSQNPLDPLLGSLTFNGGLTETHVLLPGSPAINAGNNSQSLDENSVALVGDQRGPQFSRIVSGTVDIGAIESGISFDMGDLPAPYPTLLAENGPLHVSGSPLFFGPGIDADNDGQPTADADGDDIDAQGDDESGITHSGLIAGETSNLQVNLTQPGIVSGWADFDNSGTFDQTERIIINAALPSGTSAVPISVPLDSQRTVAFRFRVSSQAGLLPTGAAPDGEVEDYLWNVTLLDFGDAPAPYPTLFADDGARHWASTPYLGTDPSHQGTSRDQEPDGQPSPNLDADDLNGNNDEDGVTTISPIYIGQTDAQLQITVQASVAGAKLNAWIDFNNDGNWNGADEQIAVNTSVFTGINAITFDVPEWAVAGSLAARFRLNTVGDLSPTGLAFDGEVEDHLIPISSPLNSPGTFGPARNISNTVAYNVDSIDTVDLDGDGDLDVVTASSTHDYIDWYENDGTGSFTAHQISNSLQTPRDIHATDLDRDGDVDLLMASDEFDTIVWYENDGNENFTYHTLASAGQLPRSLFTVDLDQDGDTDIVSASALSGGLIAWYENNGSQSFTQHSIDTSQDGAFKITAADIDSDGNMDLLAAVSIDDRVIWYQNNGNQNFTTRVISSTADGANDVSAVDMDGDGDLDVLASIRNDDTIAWFENDGTPATGSWPQHVITSTLGTLSVVPGDMDGDGDIDIVASTSQGAVPSAPNTFVWYENDGNQNFTFHLLATANTGRIAAVADIDGDHLLDVVASATGESNSPRWYQNIPHLVVSTLTDELDTDYTDGDFSLRETIEMSNFLPGQQTITFAQGLTGSLVLNGTELSITDSVIIDGPGADQLAIDGDSISRIFNITASGTTKINGLTLTGGYAPSTNGGAINFSGDGDLFVDAISIHDNTAGASGGGLMVFTNGSVVVRNSTISNNTAAGEVLTSNGAGARFAKGTIHVLNSTISGNTATGTNANGGGIIINTPVTVAITNSTIVNNSAHTGGGIHQTAQNVTLNNSIVAGNSATSTNTSDITGQINAASAFNLLGGEGTGGLTHGTNGNIVGNNGTGVVDINTVLGTLGDFGGPTQTHVPLANSPVINAGNDSLAVDQNSVAFTNDQRATGFSRFHGTVDIGAVEYDPNAAFPPIISLPSDSTTSDSQLPFSWTSVPNAISYDVWYTYATTNASPYINQTVFNTTYTPSAELPIGRYFIWVRANLPGNTTTDWSNSVALTVSVPAVLDPVEFQQTDLTPTFTWAAIPGATRYEIWGNNVTTGTSQIITDTNIDSDLVHSGK